MNPARLYQYLTRSRAKLFDWIRPLSGEDYSREFPFGMKSLRATLPHMLNAEFMYAGRMSGIELPLRVSEMQFPVDPKHHPEFGVLETAWREQSERTTRAIAGVRDWNAPLEYRVSWDGPVMRIRTTPGDVMSQLVIHEVHHRAQCMSMLRQVGVAAEDLDYSYSMYTREQVEQ